MSERETERQRETERERGRKTESLGQNVQTLGNKVCSEVDKKKISTNKRWFCDEFPSPLQKINKWQRSTTSTLLDKR